ncbi:MAG: sigma-70 family RNA polymerase sigma factor [Planctomycetaceae bacterium]|nr:sigma-70 family RNA polymerase sigma factor [Planctomycetaceae bacterium]
MAPMSQSKPVDTGDEFARLLVKNDRALFRYILTFVSRHGDAEEILQRVATVLWRKFPEYDSTREFLPWAFRIAYFEILKFRTEASRNRLIFSEDVMEALAETREAESAVLEAQEQALHECLGKLSADSALLLRRRYCDSETVAVLASEQGTTTKALYRRLDRLRDLVADCIERRVNAAGASAAS